MAYEYSIYREIGNIYDKFDDLMKKIDTQNELLSDIKKCIKDINKQKQGESL